MTTDIANIFKNLLINSNALFLDRVEGLVKTESQFINNEQGKQVLSTFPVACIPNPVNCDDDNRKVTPDDKYRTVIYFEEQNPPHIVDYSGHESVWECTLRLVCWINMAKFTITSCSLSAPIIQQVYSLLPIGQAQNFSPYLKLKVVDVVNPRKLPNLFANYTYNEDLTKYLTFPFDYFAMDITVRYSMNNACIPLITLNDNDCIT